jgi:two-component system, LuxR family, response regulator FixJ
LHLAAVAVFAATETDAMIIHRELAKAKPVILVIDDDPAVRNSLKFALEIEGFSVRLYPTGAELLDEKDMPESGCLVADYRLPGMNGLDLLARLQERNVRLPAILITTHPTAAIRDRAALAGVRLIEKPLLTDTLFQWIRAALGEPAGRP